MPASSVITRLRVGLGSLVAVEAEAGSARQAERAISAGFDAIATVERTMHPVRAGSDLAALAASRPGVPLRLHAWTWEVLRLCRELWQASDGVFDPCLGDAPGRMDDLEFPEPERVLTRASVRIDLGGIAKGYAVDRALESLRTAGCTAGLVNAGGDLAVFGDEPRAIARRDSRGDAWALQLMNAAVATSDAGAADRPPEHRGYYHGVERCVVRTGSTTVTAPLAVLADALTKCTLLCEPARSEQLLARYGAREIRFARPGADRSPMWPTSN